MRASHVRSRSLPKIFKLYMIHEPLRTYFDGLYAVIFSLVTIGNLDHIGVVLLQVENRCRPLTWAFRFSSSSFAIFLMSQLTQRFMLFPMGSDTRNCYA